jgi:hypothetical protein
VACACAAPAAAASNSPAVDKVRMKAILMVASAAKSAIRGMEKGFQQPARKGPFSRAAGPIVSLENRADSLTLLAGSVRRPDPSHCRQICASA